MCARPTTTMKSPFRAPQIVLPARLFSNVLPPSVVLDARLPRPQIYLLRSGVLGRIVSTGHLELAPADRAVLPVLRGESVGGKSQPLADPESERRRFLSSHRQELALLLKHLLSDAISFHFPCSPCAQTPFNVLVLLPTL